MSGLYCGARKRGGLTCTAAAVYVVGAFGQPDAEYRTACERHLGKVIRWQVERLDIADGVVAVAVIHRPAPTT